MPWPGCRATKGCGTVSAWPWRGRRPDRFLPIGMGLGRGLFGRLAAPWPRATRTCRRGNWPGRRSTRPAGALGRLADELTCDPASSCPPGQFVSTWKYILRKGVLFQSTLTLAWLDRHFFHVAMVGDGGCVWRSYPADGPTGNRRRIASWPMRSRSAHGLGHRPGRPERAGVRLLARRGSGWAVPLRLPHRRRGTRAGPQPGGAARRTGKIGNRRAGKHVATVHPDGQSKNARGALTTT